MIPFVPEKTPKEGIDNLFCEWEELSEKIRESHTLRRSGIHEEMQMALSLYEKLLVLVSEVNVFDIKGLCEYEVVPINAKDRYLFVKGSPGKYAAYRQLDELFKETKKKIARLRSRGH